MDPSGPFDAAEEVKFFPEKYLTRKQWGSTYADSKEFSFCYARKILVTFTGTGPCSNTNDCAMAIKEAQLKDKESGLPDIRHNFIIGGDGYTYEGRSWMENPDVPEKHEKDKPFILSVGYVGQFGDTPNEDQEKAFQELVTVGKDNILIVRKPEIFTYLTEPT